MRLKISINFRLKLKRHALYIVEVFPLKKSNFGNLIKLGIIFKELNNTYVSNKFEIKVKFFAPFWEKYKIYQN